MVGIVASGYSLLLSDVSRARHGILHPRCRPAARTLREAEFLGSGMLASRMHDTDFQGPGVSGALQPRNNMIHIQNPKKDPGFFNRFPM